MEAVFRCCLQARNDSQLEWLLLSAVVQADMISVIAKRNQRFVSPSIEDVETRTLRAPVSQLSRGVNQNIGNRECVIFS